MHYREALLLPGKANPEVIIDARNDSQRMQFPAFQNSGDQGHISPPLQPSPSYGDNEQNNNTGRSGCKFLQSCSLIFQFKSK